MQEPRTQYKCRRIEFYFEVRGGGIAYHEWLIQWFPQKFGENDGRSPLPPRVRIMVNKVEIGELLANGQASVDGDFVRSFVPCEQTARELLARIQTCDKSLIWHSFNGWPEKRFLA